MKVTHLTWTCLFVLNLVFLTGCTEEEPPQIDFQSEAAEAAEGEEITIPFNIPLPEGVTPVFSLSGTAGETTDFTYTISSSGFVFSTIDDVVYDPNETIIVTLTNFSEGAALGIKKVHTLTITETPLTVEFQSVSSKRIEGQAIAAVFNQSLPKEVVPTYRISGTADPSSDYTASLGSNGFVVSVKKDEFYDNGETVIIEMTGISGNAVLGEKKVFTVTIEDEDEAAPAGLRIELTWEAPDLQVSDVDVDLLVWLEISPGVYQAQGGLWSAIIGTAFETILIPANEKDGKYALSYVYFSGSSNNLKVKTNFRSFRGNINGTTNRSSYSKTYTLANINAFTSPYTTPLVVAQTFTKTAGDYNNLSDINVASSGSRTGEIKFILDEESRRIIETKRARMAGLRN